MARDKRKRAEIAGTHVIYENRTGFVLADRLTRQVQMELAARLDTAKTLATLDQDGQVIERHSVSVAGRALSPGEIALAQEQGLYGWHLRPLAPAPDEERHISQDT